MAGLDMHEPRITATLRLCGPGIGQPLRATHQVTATAIEGAAESAAAEPGGAPEPSPATARCRGGDDDMAH